MKLYKNGQEVDYRGYDLIPSGTLIRANTGPLTIGRIPLNIPRNTYYQGVLDELRVLDRALTAAEVQADYGESYKSSGSLTSVLITPPAQTVWESFYADDLLPPDTDITFSVLDENGAAILSPVVSGDDLSFVGGMPIRLQAVLSTASPSATPVLHAWGLNGVETRPCDISADGTVTPMDALCVFQKYLAVCPTACGACDGVYGDINQDSSTTPMDALCVFQEYLGIGCAWCE